MLIRVRSNVGIWRVDNINETNATISDVLEGIASTRPNVVYEKELSFDPNCNEPIDTTRTLLEQNIKHGSMIYCKVDASTCAEHVVAIDAPAAEGDNDDPNTTKKKLKQTTGNMKRIIDKDGTIKLIPASDIRNENDDRGFRKGMMPLRDIKMHWTINEFVALDDQYTFKLKRQENAFCKQVSLDAPSVHDFQSFLQRFDFSRKRVGYLYGKYVDMDEDDDNKEKRKKTIVEAIYEPPQDVDHEAAEGFVLLDDPMEEAVESIANMLGLCKVGWIFAHPPGRDLTEAEQKKIKANNKEIEDTHPPYVLSNAEVLMAAELQLEAAGGIEETPFVTVKVTKGKDGNVSVEAFQVSQQCMEMAAEEALEIDPNISTYLPNVLSVNEKFTAIQEGKPSKTIDNDFFLTVVPIISHTSETFVSTFPKANRDYLDDRQQNQEEMKKQLSKSGSSGWTFIDLLSDFNLLIYLSKLLDINADLPKICQSVVDKSIPLEDGYKIIISSMAGLDGHY